MVYTHSRGVYRRTFRGVHKRTFGAVHRRHFVVYIEETLLCVWKKTFPPFALSGNKEKKQ